MSATTKCVVERKDVATSVPVFEGALAQAPQQVVKNMVRLSSLLKSNEKEMARKKMAAVAVQECDGGPVKYLHVDSMVPETAVVVRDRDTGALVGLPAVMGG